MIQLEPSSCAAILARGGSVFAAEAVLVTSAHATSVE